MDLEVIIKKFKQDEEESSPDALLEYVQTIENFFAGTFDVVKLDSYLGLIFPDSTSEGLYGFLRRKITDKKYDKIKERSFNLIQFILVQNSWKNDVNRFCLTFKTISDIYWKQPKESARMQQAALDCLIALFENFGNEIDLDEFSIAELFWELLPRSEKSSFQPTVRAKMFHLMGIIGALGKDGFMKDEQFLKIFRHMISTVKSQVESTDAHLEVSILHGCMKGLDRLLGAYGEVINSKDPSWLKFQDYLELIVNPECSIANEAGRAKLKRREFQRAALALVANHGDHLKERLLLRYKQWYQDLMTWSKSANSDDNKVGRRAIYKYLGIVIEYAKQIQMDDQSSIDVTIDVEAFVKFFMEKFKQVLSRKDSNSSKIELGIAVRGYGMLASLRSEVNQSLEMLELMVGHIDGLIQELENTKVDKYSSVLSVLPTYLESVASILSTLNNETSSIEIPESYLDSIKKLTIAIIRFYPDLGGSQKYYCHIAVRKLFDALWLHHHSNCEPFIEQVYQQSLLYVVSCSTRAEIDILVEAWNKSNPDSKKSAVVQLGLRSAVSYVKFWTLLLSGDSSDSADLRYDLLMKWILSTINKLDLSINLEDADVSEITLDPIQGATATTMKDFQIFINIVDFFQELMGSNRSLHLKFQKWIPVFSNEMLAYTKTNTLVSGFYKILSVVFDASRSVKYFERENTDGKELHKRLNMFFRDLATKIREYRDDLLFAVLELWLSLPDAIILSNITALDQTLQTVFSIGRNTLSLAVKGLDAIERWFFQPEFPPEEIDAIMNNIYPILKGYFLSDLPEINEVKPAQKESDLKNLIKKNVKNAAKPVEEITLKTTQIKILHLLGSFGQCLEIDDHKLSGLSKDRRFLLYAIPFKESKPEFYIDDILPRVLELCENSVERQTRISACEFFHTICIYFIGSQKVEAHVERLFRKIFDAMLRLGCDSDITVRQLFNPLCLQAIHWFTKQNSLFDLEMLGSITDALSQHRDLGLRELAAVCISEYFIWAHKNLADNRRKDVLKTVFAMSTHASPDYRQGSVLAFNGIYREFREDDTLVDEFTFNLLFSFLTSLKLSKDLPKDCLLTTSTKQSIKHLERILNKRKDRFNTALTRQFKPAATNKIPVLRDVVDWLITQGGDEAPVYREECLRLADVLIKITRDYKTSERCLTFWEEKEGLENWISVAEQSFKRADRLSFLDAASSFYEFLNKSDMLSPRIFASSRTNFWTALMEVCNQREEMTEEDKLRVVDILCRLEFSLQILDDPRLASLWSFALEISKEIANLVDENSLRSLGSIIKAGGKFEVLLSRCLPLLLFDPIQEWTSASDRSSEILSQAIWYKNMAEQGLMNVMLSEHHLEELKEKLWTSIDHALFKQISTNTGPTWEAIVLNANERKVLENYLATSIFIGTEKSKIVDAIFDATVVSAKDGSFLLSTTKGRVFQKELLSALVLCDSVFAFEQLLADKPIAEVGELIQRLLELLKSDRTIRKKFGSEIREKTLANFKAISINSDLSTTMKIVVGLVAVDINACRNSEELFNWWDRSLRASHLDLKQKAAVFGYIKVFAESRKKKITAALPETVMHFVRNDVKPEHISWVEAEKYVSFILRKLFNFLEQTPSSPIGFLDGALCLVQKVAEWLNDANEHNLFQFAKRSMEKVLKNRQTDGDRKEMASRIYEFVTSTGGNKKNVEFSSVWKSCLLPIVSSLTLNATKKFFEKFIHNIIKKMEITPVCLYDMRLKIISVNLLELLVYQTGVEFFKGQDLALAYWEEERKCKSETAALTLPLDEEKVRIVYRSIVKVCLQNGLLGKSIPPENDPMRKPTLAFKHACYNTLAATLLEATADFKFFNKLLFPGKRIFEELNDDSVNYEFPVVISEDSHKSGVSSFRTRKGAPKPVETSDDESNAITNLLLDGQNLSGSSLAPEAASYDFTASSTLVDSEFYQRILGPGIRDEDVANNKDGLQEVKLEWNEINEHNCMCAFVEVLRKMAEFPENNDVKQEEKWSSILKQILLNRTVHKNVKVFIVGGIINTPESLMPYAAELTDPIVRLILTDTFGSVKMNHFVQDILLTLLSWHESTKVTPDPSSVTGLLKYIVSGVRNEAISSRRDITNYVMNILENIIKLWTPDINMIPSVEIFSMCEPNHIAEERSLVMLEVCLHILQGGQLPHKEGQHILKIFRKALSSRFKGVYTTAAKCLGLVLKKMKAEAPSDVTDQNVSCVVEKIIAAKTKASFIEMLACIQEHFPDIMIKVRDKIFELTQQQKHRGELVTILPLLLQQQMNECFTNADISFAGLSPHRDCADEFFVDIDGRGIFKNRCEKDREIWAGLDLFDLLIKNCTRCFKLLKMIDWLSQAEISTKDEVRLKFATCLLNLYKELVLQASPSEPLESSVKEKFMEVFLRMFDDEFEPIKEVVQNFWFEALSGWNQTSDLLLEIFDRIGLMKNPLNVCVGLILQRCQLSPDYLRAIFDIRLEDQQFFPFKLDTSWRFRNSSFQPLFAESLSSVKNFATLPRPLQATLMSQRRGVGQHGMNMLRSTLEGNLKFTPTLEGRNHETLSFMLSGSSAGMDIDFPSMPSPSIGDNQMDTSTGNEGSNPESNTPIMNPILKLRKKFYARKDYVFYATRTSETKEEVQEVANELEKARVSGVKTVRSYRIGELPDISIKHEDVLKTLLKLAVLDHTLGKQFLLHLYEGFIQQMDDQRAINYRECSKTTFEKVFNHSLRSADHTLSNLFLEISVRQSISLPVSLTMDLCKATNSQKLGILQLEQELSKSGENSKGPSSKRLKRTLPPKSEEEEIWIGLAEMYKDIEESDVLRNIFDHAQGCLGANEDAKRLYAAIGEALHAEGLGSLEDALKLFETALTMQCNIEDSPTETSKMFLEDSLMQCLTKLGEWSTLYEKTEAFSSLVESAELIREKNFIERLIPARMTAGMQLILRTNDDDEVEENGMASQNNDDEDKENMEKINRAFRNKFNDFLRAHLETEDGTTFFAENYPFDLAMWLLVAEVDENEDYSSLATLKIDRGYEGILPKMKLLGVAPLRKQRLLMTSLQQAAAVSDFLRWKKSTLSVGTSSVENKTAQLLKRWRKHLEFQPVDMIGSGLVASNRDCLASKIGIYLQDQQNSSLEALTRGIQEFRVEQEFWLGGLGISGKNLYVAQNSLIRIKHAGLEELKAEDYRKLMARYLSKVRLLGQDEWCKKWRVAWRKLVKCNADSEVLSIKADLLNSLVDAVRDESNGIADASSQGNMSQVIKCLNGTPGSTLTTCILSTTEELMRSCEQGSSSTTSAPLYAKLFILLKKLASDLVNLVPENELAEKMLCCVMRGCTGGKANDMLLLSNVFSLLKKFPCLNSMFNEMATVVPSYMYLPWIDQIMTAYKSSPDKYPSFKPLIDRLVLEFPQAFQLQYPEYLNENYKTFAQALKALVLPSQMHKSQIDAILSCRDEEKIITLLQEYQTFLQEIINDTRRIYGDLHVDYARLIFAEVNRIIIRSQSSSQEDSMISGEDLVRKTHEFIQKAQKVLRNKVKDATENGVNLNKLSPFLAEFHFFEFAAMERPGLYENFRCPNVQDHPVIVSFQPTVKVYSSLTLPIRLTLITNDGRRSNFLAKQGDDLRQDRRIQQLFKMSNVLFQGDATISQRNLSIETYSCIPLSPDFGMIEMVENALDLSAMIFDTPDLGKLKVNIRTQHHRRLWLEQHGGSPGRFNDTMLHLNSAKTASRQDAENCFDLLASKIKNCTLRDKIRKRSNNYSEFFSIRQNLIKSYAALCMVHWLLGIGDRHLENTMICLTSGKIVGIDFGRAFGTSNYVQPIPEMIPFRLTPQIQQLMMPYSYKGLFRESCILTLDCLMEAQETILTVADVFIQEPSLDWSKLRQTSKVAQGQESENTEVTSSNALNNVTNDETPFPFRIMKDKLRRRNPAKLIVEELKMSNWKPVPAVYCGIVENGRLHSSKDILNTEEYTDVLLDLATDKNILMRIYAGWNAWV